MPDAHSLVLLAQGGVIDDQIAVSQTRNEDKFAIGSELKAVGREDLRVQRGCYLPACKIDNG